jgi:hypothetical protein
MELISIGVPDIIATLTDMIYRFWNVLIIPAIGFMLCRFFREAELVRLWRFSIVMVSAVWFSVSLLGRFEPKNWILLAIMAFEWAEALVKALFHGRAVRGLPAKWAHYRQKAEAGREINGRIASALGYIAVGIALNVRALRRGGGARRAGSARPGGLFYRRRLRQSGGRVRG